VKLRETHKHGFDIPAPQWEPQLENLFDLRDAAVHPAPVFEESVPHPLGVNTAAEYVKYNSEKARQSTWGRVASRTPSTLVVHAPTELHSFFGSLYPSVRGPLREPADETLPLGNQPPARTFRRLRQRPAQAGCLHFVAELLLHARHSRHSPCLEPKAGLSSSQVLASPS
jgi:hypothetical protein